MREKSILTIPNILTVFRILSSPFILYFSSQQQYRWALAIFFFSSLTDWFDGIIARYYHCESLLGRWLDPLADKILTFFSYVALYNEFKILFLVVISRDIAILMAIIFSYSYKINLPISPIRISKINTGFVMLFPFLWLLEKVTNIEYLRTVLYYLTWIITITIISSTFSYICVFIKALKAHYKKY